jgi:O-antigen/teichoic acid export membrane protein
MAAGLVSFPILTRIFSVSDYGILGLITTTLLIATAITKLGLPNAIVRFYAGFKTERRLTDFYSTIFTGSLLAAAIVAALFVVSIRLIPDKFIDNNFVSLLSLCSILIFTKCATDTLTSFLRAEQRTKLYNLIMIVGRYGSLSLGILLVFFFIKGLHGFYVGQIVSGIIILFFLLYIFRKSLRISLASFSPAIFKDSLKYGFPLVWAELGHLVLNFADRYLIQLYLGSIPLGLYTAGYNLATYATEMIIYPINYAMTPIYMNILVNKGEQQTKEFFTKLFTYFSLIMLPSVFGFIAVGKDLISLLASTKYAESYLVLPYVVIGQAIYACTIILNSGLFISKKTYVVTYVMMGVCVLNIALNIVLIPRYGIIGAAQATLISCILYAVILTHYSMREFKFPLEYRRIFLYLFASCVMFITIREINFAGYFANILVKVAVGALLYSLFVFLLDGELRRKSVGLAKSLRSRYAEFTAGQ